MGDRLPHCFSKYKKFDYSCDGNPDSTDSEERQPCDLKRVCRAFRNHLKDHELDIDSFLTETDDGYESNGGDGAFLDFCKKLSNVKKKRNRTDTRIKGPSYATKVAAKKAKQSIAKKNKEKLLEKFDFFVRKLLENMVDYEFAVSGTIPVPGKLYVADRSGTSGYVAVYVRANYGRDALLIYLKLRPATGTFDAFLTCRLSEMEKSLSKTTLGILKPVERKNKNFNVLIKGLDKRKLSLMAESIGQLVSAGILGLKRCR